ncbi:T-box transcription factor TBX20 [Aphelenchoides avenae]|nr:T-box transcription factor TBX20 [Aphelenchus avenae]
MSLVSLKRPLCRSTAIDPLICPKAKQPKLASNGFFIASLVSDRPKSDDEQSLGSDGSVQQHSPKSEVDALSQIVTDNVQHPKSEVKSEAPSLARQRKTKSPRHSDVKDNAGHPTSTSVAAAGGAWEKNWTEPGRSESLRHVRCHLEDRDLWREFDHLGTEMIITKSGR